MALTSQIHPVGQDPCGPDMSNSHSRPVIPARYVIPAKAGIHLLFASIPPSRVAHHTMRLLWSCTQMLSKNVHTKKCSDATCGRGDSNPHSFRNWILNPACLPIPPLSHLYCTVLGRTTALGIYALGQIKSTIGLGGEVRIAHFRSMGVIGGRVGHWLHRQTLRPKYAKRGGNR